MITLKKTPVRALLISSAFAVLPTIIVAHFFAPAASSHDRPSDVRASAPGDFAEPTTHPSRMGGGGMGGEGRIHSGQMGRPASPEEIEAAVAFFNENSPNRMAYFSKLPEGPRRRQSNLLVQFYRPILNFKLSDPKLYDLMVQQVKLRDDAFELAKEGKDAELREKAGEIVTISLQARSKRLEILQKQIADQQQQLAQDQANPDSAAEREVSSIKEDEQRLVSRAERPDRPQSHGQSMLDFNPASDPLAEGAPIVALHRSQGGS